MTARKPDGCDTALIQSTASRTRPPTSGSFLGPDLGGNDLVTYTARHVFSKRPLHYRPTLEYSVCSCRCHSDLHGTGGSTPRARVNEHRRLALPLTPGNKRILEQLLGWYVENGKRVMRSYPAHGIRSILT